MDIRLLSRSEYADKGLDNDNYHDFVMVISGKTIKESPFEMIKDAFKMYGSLKHSSLFTASNAVRLCRRWVEAGLEAYPDMEFVFYTLKIEPDEARVECMIEFDSEFFKTIIRGSENEYTFSAPTEQWIIDVNKHKPNEK